MKLSKGSRIAILAFVLLACIAAGVGVYDLATKGSAPGVFLFAGIMLAIALLTFFLSKRTDGRATAVALLLLGAAAAACQRTPTPEQAAETRVAAAADTSWATVTEREQGWDVTRAK